mgnify:CR=1 FL=1
MANVWQANVWKDGRESHATNEVNFNRLIKDLFCIFTKWHLIYKDCDVLNGHCGPHQCIEFVIGDQTYSECVCNKDFQSATIYDDCLGKNHVLLL